MKEIITLDNIKRDFHVGDETVHALRGVSFTIREGEFVTIMGTSGSGKSTLLNTLGCLDTPTSGEYYLDGVSVRTMNKRQRATLRNRKIGFVFQAYHLLPELTVLENVMIGRHCRTSAGIAGAVFQDSRTKAEEQATIDRSYELAVKAGAEGGKLLGAGGGGFMLFYVKEQNHQRVRNALSDLKEMPFKFDNKGTTLIHYNKHSLKGRF